VRAAQRVARRAAAPIWLASALGVGLLWGIELAFLTLAAGALGLVVALLWSSVQSLTGGASVNFEEALSMGAPSKMEEQKRAVLRALKDLEYERSVGKISPEDYAELSARYRAEAKRLIQRVDQTLEPARARVEATIAKRLARAGLPPDVAATSAVESDAEPARAQDPVTTPDGPDAAEAAKP